MPTLEVTSNIDLPRIEDWFAPDSRRITFSVEQDGDPRDITNDDIEWGLYDQPYGFETNTPIVDTADSGVVLTTPDPENGVFEVRIEQDTLTDTWGAVWQYIVIDGPLETQQSWRGEVFIESA